MSRPAELFAVSTIALLATALLCQRLSILSSFFISVRSRSITYAVPPEAVLFGFGALFGVFAFVYSLWMMRLNRSAAMWHFWLSAISILLLAIGFVALADLPKVAAPTSSLGSVRAVTAFIGMMLGLLVFIAGQVVFVANVVFTAIHTQAER